MGCCCIPVGKEPCCCFYCCILENMKTRTLRVFSKFKDVSLSTAELKPEEAIEVIACAMLPTLTPEQITRQRIYSPIANTPCVFWRAVVQERWKVIISVMSSDPVSSQTQTKTKYEWRTIIDHQNCADFYLQDGGAKLLVQGSSGYEVETDEYASTIGPSTGPHQSSNLDQAYENTFDSSSVPRQVQWMKEQGHLPAFKGWEPSETKNAHKMGQFRWAESIIEVDAKIAAFGVVKDQIVDPFTQERTRGLAPVENKHIDEEFMESNGWSHWDTWAWGDLMSDKESTLMLATSGSIVGDVEVQRSDESIGQVQKLKAEYTQWKTFEPWNHLVDGAPGLVDHSGDDPHFSAPIGGGQITEMSQM